MTTRSEEKGIRGFAVASANAASESAAIPPASGGLAFAIDPMHANAPALFATSENADPGTRSFGREASAAPAPGTAGAAVWQFPGAIAPIPAVSNGIQDIAGPAPFPGAGSGTETGGLDPSNWGSAGNGGLPLPTASPLNGGMSDQGLPGNVGIPAPAPDAGLPGNDISLPADVVSALSQGAAGTGNAGSGSSTGTASSGSSGGSGHLVINLSYDASVSSAPAGFTAALTSVVQFFEDTFANPITINIDVGYGEIGGYLLESGALGESESYLYYYSYSQVAAALRGDPGSAGAAASLPATNPTGNGQFMVTTADAEALALLPGSGQGLNGYVGFGSNVTFDYNDSNGVSPGQYDFFGVAAHEISEVLGRQMTDGQSGAFEPLDLFHYAAPGVRSFTGTQTGYFSTNGGVTDLANFNTNPGGDFGDWASSVVNDSFRAYSYSGVVNQVSSADIAVMNALGWISATAPTPAPAYVAFDFAGNGTSDVLWRNTVNGDTVVFEMSNGSVASSTDLGGVANVWQVSGIGNFDGTRTSDILWRNTASGADVIFGMSGGTVASTSDLGGVGTAWTVAGIGDFTGNGTDDILWRNATSGDNVIFYMNGGSVASTSDIGTFGSAWTVAGVGDFNGDGKADILWRNTLTGDDVIFGISGSSVSSTTDLGILGTAWAVAGIGDFTGDGTSDILWRNQTTGDTVLDLMKGNAVASATDLGAISTDWTVAEVGDFNGDGKADILWQNAASGATEEFLMNGASIVSTVNLGGVSTIWSIAKAGGGINMTWTPSVEPRAYDRRPAVPRGARSRIGRSRVRIVTRTTRVLRSKAT